jgi:N-acyl homoserine lactone hydrolase
MSVDAVDVMVVADLPMPEAYALPEDGAKLKNVAGMFRGPKLQSHCLAYAVRHSEAGTILIDTGLHPDASQSVRKDYGAAMALFFRGIRPARRPYAEMLRERGIEPDAVERVIMTHLHVDHTSAMRLLPSARFVCTRDEWEAATGSRATAQGYVARHLPPESRMDLLDFERSGERLGPFASTIDLLGDGSIRLISTPGHTRGHLSVLLNVADGRTVLVVGDAVYTLRNLEEERAPLLVNDKPAYFRSLRELKAYAAQEPEAILVPTHDPDAWRALASAGAHSEDQGVAKLG